MSKEDQAEPGQQRCWLELAAAVENVASPPIPDVSEFIADEWWKVKPDSHDGQILMLKLRHRQTATALAEALAVIQAIDARLRRLEMDHDGSR